MMLRRVRILALTALTLGGLAGPFSTSFAILDKTRFVVDLGMGFFAFHHWVLKPYQQGKFAAGAPGRVGSMVKGGLALLFAVHEVKAAEHIAATSKDPLLQKLDAGLNKLTGSFASAGQALKGGQLDTSQIDQLTQITGDVANTAAASGTVIKDVPTAIPGL